MKPIIDPEVCKHPYTRIFSAIVKEVCNDPDSNTLIWFACMDCGEVLGEKLFKKGRNHYDTTM